MINCASRPLISLMIMMLFADQYRLYQAALTFAFLR